MALYPALSYRPAARPRTRRAHRVALVLAFVVAAGVAQAQAPAGPAATPGVPPSSTADAGAPLVVFNRTVFVFRAPFLGLEPAERARSARARIQSILGQIDAPTATVEQAPQGAIVLLDGVLAFGVTPQDADVLHGESAVEAAQRAARVLGTVVAETREARSVNAMLVATAHAAAATALLLATAWGLSRARRWLIARLTGAFADRAERLRVGGVHLVARRGAVTFVRRTVNLAYWVVFLIAAYQWLGFVLQRFPYTRPWGERLNGFLTGAAREIVEGVARAMPELAIALAIFVIARTVAGLLTGFLRRVQAGKVTLGWLDADTARPTQRVVVILVWVFALVMAYPYLPGSETDAFKGVSVLVGLMVSLGASSIVAQAASGLILMYTRTLRPGEYVRVGDHEGMVVELTMFAIRIRTGFGEELTLPSALVLGTVTRNYSRAFPDTGVLLEAEVTIGYDAPWRQVHAMLAEAARRTPGVAADPPPRVFQTALSDFYVAYRLVCVAAPAAAGTRADAMSTLYAHVQDVFNEHGVQIMSPHYVADPDAAKVVPKARWHAPPAPPAAGEG